MSRWFYNLALLLALPVASLQVAWRGLREREWWRGWRERFGLGAARGAAPLIWLHGASVGEVQAASGLMNRLRGEWPEAQLLLTASTPAGRARAQSLVGAFAEVRFAPYDLPWLARRDLRRRQPKLLVVLETELWPNRLHACARAGVPVLLVSARISARSAHWFARLPGLLGDALRHGVWVQAQSDEDLQRLRGLGVPPERSSVGGNIKFDFELAPELPERGRELRAALAPDRHLWVAGSTREGEEPLILQAHRALLDCGVDSLLVLAPRHSARFERVAAMLTASGFRWRRRSAAQDEQRVQVLLLDTIGELMSYYAAADAALVGGSLVPAGGHNLLEPLALGVPTLTGPHQFNAPDVARALLEAGAIFEVADAAALHATLKRLHAGAGESDNARRNALAVLQRERGATQRALAAIRARLPGPQAR